MALALCAAVEGALAASAVAERAHRAPAKIQFENRIKPPLRDRFRKNNVESYHILASLT
jgi:hypothetical protein